MNFESEIIQNRLTFLVISKIIFLFSDFSKKFLKLHAIFRNETILTLPKPLD